MCVQKYRARPVEVEAIQFKLGETTKTELRDFCPQAVIGAREGDDTDIRWFYVPPFGADVLDGDWFMKMQDGSFRTLGNDEFTSTYEAAYSFRGDDD